MNLIEQLGRLRKSGKAAGKSGILPEMIKTACCDTYVFRTLLNLVHLIWKEGVVPQEWVDAVLVPISKKRNLKSCDNWKGIVLLDVVGKIVACNFQKRLQRLAEDVLPKSQCGFRKSRSCADMIFAVRQLVEKSWEHQTKSFLTFTDLKKAYDSVPRNALWKALGKLGVPEATIQLNQTFHSNMKASIRLDGELLEEISAQNGLRHARMLHGSCVV